MNDLRPSRSKMMQYASKNTKNVPSTDGKKIIRLLRASYPECEAIVADAVQHSCLVEQRDGYYFIYK